MNNRRTFIWKFGAGASAALASTAGLAAGTSKTEAVTTGDPVLRAAMLEEERALRKLHQVFEQTMDLELFADDAKIDFNGRVFTTQLFHEHCVEGKIGRRMEQAPGFELTAEQQEDRVEVSPDLRSAKAMFPYSIQVGTPIETESSLAAMARLHGEGVRTWWEGGVYRINYKKDSAGLWKMTRLEYNTLSRADYRPGKRYALPISV